MKATRRTAREWAIQMLTAADLNPPDNVRIFMDDYWRQISDLDDDCKVVRQSDMSGKSFETLKQFAEERVAGVLATQKEIDSELESLLDNWDLYRLGTVERMVLRMGVWEMRNTDIPHAVVINEAIDLSNWFSSSKGRTLINGVLDRYAKRLAV